MEKITDIIKDTELKEFAQLLLDNDYIISTMDFSLKYISNKGLQYFDFQKGDVYGHVTMRRFEGYSISSNYVPDRTNGDGAVYAIGWDILTLENAEKVKHFGGRDTGVKPKFYTGFDHFRKTKERNGANEMIYQAV